MPRMTARQKNASILSTIPNADNQYDNYYAHQVTAEARTLWERLVGTLPSGYYVGADRHASAYINSFTFEAEETS